jgi:hypothetical protein
MIFLSAAVLYALLALANAKLTEVPQTVLVMDDKDRIIGKTRHVFLRDDSIRAASAPPSMPGLCIIDLFLW